MSNWNYGFNPHQGQLPGGFNRRGTSNYRGGFRQHHSDLSVNDEMVGPGDRAGRKAPPAHSGANYSNFHHPPSNFPPYAHGGGGYFQGFGGYGFGGYQGLHHPNFHQGYHGMSSRDRRQSRGSDDDRQQGRRSSDDRSPQARGSSQQQTEDMREASKRPRDGVRELEKDTETTSSSGRPDRNAKQGPRESQPTMKDATKQEHDRTAKSQEATQNLSPQAAQHSSPPPAAGHAHNRRKQYTPQKVPVGPGGSSGTMSIITQKGLALDEEAKSTVKSPNDIQSGKAKTGGILETPKVTSENSKDDGASSSPKSRTRRSISRGELTIDKAVEQKAKSPASSSDGRPEHQAIDQLRADETPPRRRSKGEMKAFPTQDGLQPSQMQTGICTKSPEKPSKVVGSTTGGSAVVSDAVEKPMAVSDKKTGKKQDSLVTPPKGSESSSPGETSQTSFVTIESRKESSGSTPSPTKRSKEMYRKVEADLEAMFAGIGSPEKVIGEVQQAPTTPSLPPPSTVTSVTKPLSPVNDAPTAPAEFVNPETERKSTRSKRKSAQTAELKIRENQSEDYSMYQPRIRMSKESQKPARPAAAAKEAAKVQLNESHLDDANDCKGQTKTNKDKQVKDEKVGGKKANKAAENKMKEEPLNLDATATQKIIKEEGKTTVQSVTSSRPRRRKSSPVKEDKPPQKIPPIMFVDETAVASEDLPTLPQAESIAKEVKDVATKEEVVSEHLTSPGRRTRRSRGSAASNPVSPVKGCEEKEEVSLSNTSTSEGRPRRKRALSIDVAEDLTQSPKSPAKKLKRLSNSQEIEKNKIGLLQTVEKEPAPILPANPGSPPVRTSVRGKDSAAINSLAGNQHEDCDKSGPIMTPINDNKSVNSPLTKKAAKQTLKSKIKDDKVKKTKKVDEENAPEAKGKKNIKGRPDWKGPYVHLEGEFRSPRTVNVINSINAEGNENSQKVKRGLVDSEFKVKAGNYVNWTLSKQYDHKTADDTWRCVFCNEKSHFKRLGDLFGPYYVPTHCIEQEEKKPKSKRKSINPESDTAEIWFHEDCFCWIPGVYLVGSRIVGMEEGVSVCRSTRCMTCGQLGASLGCTRPGCRVAVHVPCSLGQAWSTDMSTFKATCPKCNSKNSSQQ